MKTLAGGIAFVAVLLLANVVAAGVFLVLGPLVPRSADIVAVAGLALVGVIAVGCSILFFLGAMHHIPALISRKS
jgi:drug/metabolite transporter (DMT)-like permease